MLGPNKYNWKRFWCPREGNFRLTESGYLEDPDGPYGSALNPETKTLGALAEVPCLVLLGEPGLGKSEELDAQAQSLTHIQNGEVVLKFELRDFQTDIKLCQDIFGDDRFQKWVNGTHRLYLFLDSLDEGLLSINTLATLLERELKKYPSDRLSLRITCRTAEWPDILEHGLRQHWGDEALRVYELLPLRERDVTEAARAEGINTTKFLEELREKDVIPLAIKPTTLKFLLNTYRKHGQLPHTQTELYLLGCQQLCEETNKSRLASRRKGALSARQRLNVASRIAAVSIFANRSAIRTDVDAGDVPGGDVTVSELSGGTEGAGTDRFQVGEEEVREALNTGLFSSRGANRIGWAHQTYAEFLAAHYLVEHRMPPNQMVSLVTHAGDSQQKLVPQLHEAAAWLAGMDIEVFREIMKADPAVLLRSDIATVDAKDKSALVEGLLRCADNDEWTDRDHTVHKYYPKLKHRGLAAQLRPYILDRNRGLIARRVATDIAEACNLKELQNDLATVALDQDENYRVRVNAAYAVTRLGDSSTKAMLKPLATGTAGDDPEDELKGCGLDALWPDQIPAAELFDLITYPKRTSLLGSYQSFLYSFCQKLQPPDLVKGLRWVRANNISSDSTGPFSVARRAIIQGAWENLDTPGVLEELAQVMMNGLRDSYREREEVSVDEAKRHKVLEALVPLMHAHKEGLLWLVFGTSPFLTRADLPWFVHRLLKERSTEIQEALAEIISRLFDWRDSEHTDLIITASASNPILAKKFAWLLNPVELGSPEAEQQRKQYEEAQQFTRPAEQAPLLEPPPSVRVSRLLDRFESGDMTAWWRLNLEMTLETDSTHYLNELRSDLTSLPGWKGASDETKVRIVEAAKTCLLNGDPETKKWLGKNIIYRPAFAGYRALRLLLSQAPQFIHALPEECWRKWAPIVVTYPAEHGNEHTAVQQKLVELTYKYAPAEVISTALKQIDEDNKRSEYLFVLPTLECCWEEALIKALEVKVRDKKLKPACMGQILTELISRGSAAATQYAESLVVKRPRSAVGKAKSITAARTLLTSADDAGWSVIWPKVQRDAEFGREVIVPASGIIVRRKSAIYERLAEDQLADLFIWMFRQYPYKDDPHHEGTFVMGPDDHARQFRDAILNHLKGRGTPQSVIAVRRVIRDLPELTGLKWVLLETQEQTRRQTWAPLQPSAILELADNEQLRLVQNGAQLLEVLVESLKRLEVKLRGETPAAIDLWNEVKPGVYRPRDENRFSDYVKRHLDEDLRQRGVIANREVEIRRGEGSVQGERTDIHVDAVLKGPGEDSYDQVTVIIETKGCWNAELNRAMETQLKNRYLRENQCRYGLYLVGWFNCKQWDKGDYRSKKVPKMSKEEAQEQFSIQAASLSEQGVLLKAFVLNTSLPS